MRPSITTLIAAGALAVLPAVAFAGARSTIGMPPSQLLPMSIQTPTATLTTGGSVVKVVVPVIATGNQGFQDPIQLDVCLGASQCKETNISIAGNGAKKGTINFPLMNTVTGPVRVSLQVTAQTTSFRSVLRTFRVTAR